MKLESKFIAVTAIIIALLIVGTIAGVAYILSNYDERETDVYELPIQVSIVNSSDLPVWESVAYKGLHYNFNLELYAEDHDAIASDDIGSLGAGTFSFFIVGVASPCNTVTDVIITLFIDDTWQSLDAHMNSSALEMTLTVPVTLKAGEFISIPGEIVFNSVQKVTVGFYCINAE